MPCHLRSLRPWVGIIPFGLCFIYLLWKILEARMLRQCNRISVSHQAESLLLAQKPHSNGATEAAAAATGDHPQERTTDLLSSPPQEACGWRTSVKVTRRVQIAGAEREPFAEVHFNLGWVRNGTQAEVKVKVDQVEYGVTNCCTAGCSASSKKCNKNCKTAFVRKMTIQVRPKSCAQDCRRMQLQPHYEAKKFVHQRGTNHILHWPLFYLHRASVSFQNDKSVSCETPLFEWSPAWRDDASKSVSWAVDQVRDADGRNLEVNGTRWGSRPSLGTRPSQMHFPRGSFLAEATWELSPNAQFHQQWLEWDVKITLEIAVVKGKGRLLGYKLTPGPTLTFDMPIQFSEPTKQG